MQMKKLLKPFLLTAALLVGANAWADTTIGSTAKGWGEEGSITTAYTLSAGKTLTFNFTVDKTGGNWWEGYVAILAKTTASTWGDNQYVFLRANCDYIIGSYTQTAGQESDEWSTGALKNENTYGGATKVTHYTGASVTMEIKRVGTNAFITTAITKEATTYYHYYQQNLGTTDDVYAFLAADAAQLTIIGDAITDNGLTLETYDFKAANPVSSTGCSSSGAITVDGSSLQILQNTAMDLKDRFAGGTKSGGVSNWYILRNSGGLQDGSGNLSKDFAILNLTAGDYVTINYNVNGAAFTFIGENNITGLTTGTSIVSGQTYKIETTGSLLLRGARSGTNYPVINSIIIATSTPVLERPTISFDSMVKNEDLYYPKVTFTAEDGVTFKNGANETITSPYTFTGTGTLTVYAVKAGRTNSAKTTYTISNGWIQANSVAVGDLVGTINYETGAVLADNTGIGGATWVIPGLFFDGTNISYRTWAIMATSGSRTISCSVLNENRVAIIKKYYYDDKVDKSDYLTSTSNSTPLRRVSGVGQDQFKEYNLYVNPAEKVSVTIGSTGYSTFSSPVPLDFSGVSGLTAFVASSVADGNVALTSVTTAPANTGLILKGTAGETYEIPVTASAVAPASNLLVGCIVNTTVAADATSKFNNYVLVNEGGVAKFQSLVDNGATIPAGKAFLKNGAYSAGARMLNITFADETTGISDALRPNDRVVFNLSGQRVAQPQKGVYIVNGKKVIMK